MRAEEFQLQASQRGLTWILTQVALVGRGCWVCPPVKAVTDGCAILLATGRPACAGEQVGIKGASTRMLCQEPGTPG